MNDAEHQKQRFLYENSDICFVLLMEEWQKSSTGENQYNGGEWIRAQHASAKRNVSFYLGL